MPHSESPPASPAELPDFGLLTELVHEHARAAPERTALIAGDDRIDYGTLDCRIDRVAAALQRDGLQVGDCIAVCARASIAYVEVFLGALRAGVAVAPLAPGSTPASLARMLDDAQARLLFVDATTAAEFQADGAGPLRIALDGDAAATGGRPFEPWLAPDGVPSATGDDRPVGGVQHHLFVGNDR